jgi:hypothetical protein
LTTEKVLLDGTRQRVLVYHVVMAKSKSKPADRYPNPKPANYSNLFVAGKSPVPKESLGLPGKTYDKPSYAVKTLSLPQPNTPVVRDSGSSLRGMQGQGSFDPSTKNVVRAAQSAVLAGAGSAVARLAPTVGAKVFKVVGSRSASTAYQVNSAGIAGSSIGGRLFTTQTPAGPSLASTRVMTPGQQSAAKSGLYQIAENKALQTGTMLGREAANAVTKAIYKGGQILTDAVSLDFVRRNKRR